MEHLAKHLLKNNINFRSETCNKHVYRQNGKDIMKEVHMIEYKGEWVCPLCRTQESRKKLEDKVYEQHKERIEYPNRRFFYTDSIIIDETLLKANLDNYEVSNVEEDKNLLLAKQSVNDYLEGKNTTLWLQGKPGAGKSHLAYSIAKAANDTSNHKVLFVDISEFVKRIRATFEKNSQENEFSLVKKLIEADLLVLDDMGAEVGKINTNTTASDFVNRVIYSVFTGRQGKTTICTTNLTGEQIKAIYDKKTWNRMFRDYRFMKFEESKDHRFKELPF